MAITKKQRQKVWEKSHGKCWYCGCKLPEKGWHIDHIKPIIRFNNIEITEKGCRKFKDCMLPELDIIENMVPACRSCNLFKGSFSVETFKSEIMAQVERARNYSVNFRTAERFGLIKINSKPIVFWFEKHISKGHEDEN